MISTANHINLSPPNLIILDCLQCHFQEKWCSRVQDEIVRQTAGITMNTLLQLH